MELVEQVDEHLLASVIEHLGVAHEVNVGAGLRLADGLLYAGAGQAAASRLRWHRSVLLGGVGGTGPCEIRVAVSVKTVVPVTPVADDGNGADE
jgi:hypothetical protein